MKTLPDGYTLDVEVTGPQSWAYIPKRPDGTPLAPCESAEEAVEVACDDADESLLMDEDTLAAGDLESVLDDLLDEGGDAPEDDGEGP